MATITKKIDLVEPIRRFFVLEPVGKPFTSHEIAEGINRVVGNAVLQFLDREIIDALDRLVALGEISKRLNLHSVPVADMWKRAK